MVVYPVNISGSGISGNPLGRGMSGDHILIRKVLYVIFRPVPDKLLKGIILYILPWIVPAQPGMNKKIIFSGNGKLFVYQKIL